MAKDRIDRILVERGFADSRAKAQALVMAGIVLVKDRPVKKPSETVEPNAEIRLKGESVEDRYASRAGLKLEAALDTFHIRVPAYVCLDVGSSTGGFTDCLLKRGAAKVFAVDSGTNQLIWRLRSDERVVVMEKTNARYLEPDSFGCKFDLITVDVSFISLTKLLPALSRLLKANGEFVLLIKPQFEVGRELVGKGGIVRDEKAREEVVDSIREFAEGLGFRENGMIESPIKGAKGNVEYLMRLSQLR